jgi:hypothetical protein
MGASVATLAQTFDVQQYVPQEIQDDYATGSAYYEQFSQVASGIHFGGGGSIQLSDAASKAALTGMTAALTAAVPVLGAALGIILAIAPKAGAGPGVCSTDPPPGPLLSQLQSWDHFVPWNGVTGPYAAGSFEAFANPVLEYNWLLGSNCFASAMTPAPVLLAALVASWNATHAASSTRQVCRTWHAISYVADPGYDPIADALSQANYALHATKTGAGAFDTGYTGGDLTTMCFAINAGPQVAKIKPLTFRGATPAQLALSDAASKPLPTLTRPSGAGTVAVIGAAAAGAWWLSTPAGARFLAKLLRF